MHWQCGVAKHMSQRRAIRQEDVAADGAVVWGAAAQAVVAGADELHCRSQTHTLQIPATSCLVLLNEELRETPEAARESCSLFGAMPCVSASTLLCRLCFLRCQRVTLKHADAQCVQVDKYRF